MFIRYENKRIRDAGLELIEAANGIVTEYENDGYDLTLRQLYYQMVARDIIPNNQRSYKRLGALISKGRRAGLVSWEAIVDRTRNLEKLSKWETPRDVLRAAAYSYHLDYWQGQETYVEVWVEKDALTGVVGRVCDELDTPFFACRGYVSDSEMWRAARRLSNKAEDGQRPIVLHLGDHDPSGMDMTRDIKDRLDLFSHALPATEVVRIALSMEQIETYNPPPNPAKSTDSRFAEYLREYGDESWELDALEPRVMSELIRGHIRKHIDPELWDKRVALERAQREDLNRMADQYKG